MSLELAFIAVGAVLAIGVIVAHGATKFGIPSLLAFLIFGMLIGSEGIGGVEFDNYQLAQTIGTIGLAAILFEGGLSTSWRRLRNVLVPASLLSTVGVLVTAVLAGLAAYFLLDVPLLYALLVGAVISSTDAAAVFATIRGTSIKRRIARTVEAESGMNDPMAIALTIGLISWITVPNYDGVNIAVLLTEQLGIGLILGLIFGWIATKVFAHLPHTLGEFSPVASLAAGAITFGVTQLAGGSGFLAIYLVGLAIGSTPSRYRSHLASFHEGLAFVAQVVMFVVLGLLVFPSQLGSIAIPAIALALVLMLVIRPIAVWLSTFAQGFSWQERIFLGWAGLRGAVPIILATFVLVPDIDNNIMLFNVIFFVVMVSALVQGTTLQYVASKLGVVDVLPDMPEVDEIEHTKFMVLPSHAIVGSHLSELGLPAKATVEKIMRSGKPVALNKATIIQAGDRITVSIDSSLHPELEDVFMRWRRRI